MGELRVEVEVLSKDAVWDLIGQIVEEQGCQLFDIEYPSGNHGVLRIFLCNRDGRTDGIGHAQCAAVSRKVCDLPQIEEIAPGDVSIEVSSPGINRKLTRPEHFAGAVGERVKITLLGVYQPGPEQRKRSVLRGLLRQVDEGRVTLDDEETGEQVCLPRSEVKSIRVDFNFEQ